jgi:hypothetical protein
MGRPAGMPADSPLKSFARNGSRMPRTPLWATVLLLLASAGILHQSEVRTALASLYKSYTQTEWEPSGWSSVKKLQKEAQRQEKLNRDPQLLALLSLLSSDDQQRLQLSGEAIERDSSLTWLDYEQSLLPLNDLDKQQYLSAERLNRLQKWDPDNAVPRLLAAEVLAKPVRAEAFDALINHGSKLKLTEKFAKTPGWLALMESAFSAPKFDNYTTEAFDLVRNVSERYGVRDPDIALFVVSRKRSVQYDLLRAYGDFQIGQGEEAERKGNLAAATAAYSLVLRLSERMSLGHVLPLDEYFAQEAGASACKKLQPLLARTGQNGEASLVAYQLEEWRKMHDPKLLRYRSFHYQDSQWESLAWSGLLINLAGCSIALFAPVALLSFLFVWPRRKTPLESRGRLDFWTSLSFDLSPILLLISSVALFCAYHPFASACASYLKPNQPLPDVEEFVAAALVTHTVPDKIAFIRDPFSLWFGLTALLCLVVVFLIYRMTLRKNTSS